MDRSGVTFTRKISQLAGLFFAFGLLANTAAANTIVTSPASLHMAKASSEIPSPVSSKAFTPATVRVLWDTSFTQEAYETVALSFLTALIDEVRPDSLELVPFGQSANPDDRIDMRAEAEELEHFVGQLSYDGVTDISALYRAEDGRPARDACFLVTDGRFLPGPPPSRHLPCKVYVISASPAADASALALLARQGGGKYINLSELDFNEARERLSTETITPRSMITDGHGELLNAQRQMSPPGEG